jgi:hypothetical protein
MNFANVVLLILTGCALPIFGRGQELKTLSIPDSVPSPSANLSSLTWIEGHWRGKAFGGITEEVWTPALGGSMMCAFKLVIDGKVKFYEIATISEENNTLVLRLKHFHANLKGWEEKDKSIDFRLVKVTSDKIYFDQFTFERVSPTWMNIYVVIEQGGKSEEIVFSYMKD